MRVRAIPVSDFLGNMFEANPCQGGVVGFLFALCALFSIFNTSLASSFLFPRLSLFATVATY